MNFNVSNWLLQQAKLQNKQITIAGATFDLITLSDEQVEFCDKFDELGDLLQFAAEHGLAIKTEMDDLTTYERAVDVEGVTLGKIATLWNQPQFKELDPTIIEQVGMAVCEMSDLLDSVNALTPEDETHIDGDNDDLSVTMGQLQEDAKSYNSAV